VEKSGLKAIAGSQIKMNAPGSLKQLGKLVALDSRYLFSASMLSGPIPSEVGLLMNFEILFSLIICL
jgi:hypothetical protein